MLLRAAAVCVHVPGFPPPLVRSEPCPFEMFSVQCRVSQMNGPWSGEVSSGDPRVTQTQWWPGFYRKNKNRDPQAHGPCCGRGLDMATHFNGKRKKERSEGIFWILSAAWCFIHLLLPEESWNINPVRPESTLFLFDFSDLKHGEHDSLRWCLHLCW